MEGKQHEHSILVLCIHHRLAANAKKSEEKQFFKRFVSLVTVVAAAADFVCDHNSINTCHRALHFAHLNSTVGCSLLNDTRYTILEKPPGSASIRAIGDCRTA
jgi:hypothetical protein